MPTSSYFQTSSKTSLDPKIFTSDVAIVYLHKIAKSLGFQLKRDTKEEERGGRGDDAGILGFYPTRSSWQLQKTASSFSTASSLSSVFLRGKKDSKAEFEEPKELLEALLSSPSFSWESWNPCYGKQHEYRDNPFFNINTLEDLEAKLEFLKQIASRFSKDEKRT